MGADAPSYITREDAIEYLLARVKGASNEELSSLLRNYANTHIDDPKVKDELSAYEENYPLHLQQSFDECY